MTQVSFCFIWSWHVSYLLMLILREGDLAKQLAVMATIYMGEKKAFPKLKSETIVIGFNSDLKLRATKTLI